MVGKGIYSSHRGTLDNYCTTEQLPIIFVCVCVFIISHSLFQKVVMFLNNFYMVLVTKDTTFEIYILSFYNFFFTTFIFKFMFQNRIFYKIFGYKKLKI